LSASCRFWIATRDARLAEGYLRPPNAKRDLLGDILTAWISRAVVALGLSSMAGAYAYAFRMVRSAKMVLRFGSVEMRACLEDQSVGEKSKLLDKKLGGNKGVDWLDGWPKSQAWFGYRKIPKAWSRGTNHSAGCWMGFSGREGSTVHGSRLLGHDL
jgi:hypothetical protein